MIVKLFLLLLLIHNDNFNDNDVQYDNSIQSPPIILMKRQSSSINFNHHNNHKNNNRNRNYRSMNQMNNEYLWPNGIIPYRIANELQRYRTIILNAMRKIQQHTCIRFRQQTNELDFVNIVNGNGCHSIVGRKGNGKQTLSLGDGCRDVGSIIHELCHAIGLYHEHMRHDRDNYLQIKWSNIEPNMYEQFIRIPKNEYNPKHRFDYNSIMIYGSKAFSRNGSPTMLPYNRRIRLRESHNKRSLSKADIVNINGLYQC